PSPRPPTDAPVFPYTTLFRSLMSGEPVAHKAREILLRHPEITTVVTQHGRPDDGSDAAGFNNLELFAPLKPFDQWPAGLTKDKRSEEHTSELQSRLDLVCRLP